ncbi:WhiB family transcriptional regulator [Pseudonocardia sp. NPDC049635]|uniref:WhiB family transcriptional regulator n=1 Tax=Pseudonocardia sp. NPDC049635 TaxID=3155506 RepID=UPI0033EE8D1D
MSAAQAAAPTLVDPATISESFGSWQPRAACRAMGCEVFFAPENEPASARSRRERAAKLICAGCPVRQPCAVHALVNREVHGVWGGLSEDDRERLITHL